MIRILIVEYEHEVAENFRGNLILLGFDVPRIVSDSKECLEYLNVESVDLILMDIKIQGECDGIDLTEKILSKWNIPVIFITAFADKATLDRVSKVSYSAFLLKPFTVQVLESAIYLSLKGKVSNRITTGTLCVRDKGFTVPIPFSEIQYLKADGLYTKIFTKYRIYLVRDIMKNIQVKLDEDIFLRVHKSYLVNIREVKSYNYRELTIGKNLIPITRGFSKNLAARLDL
jgi:DNA-binding LytR/AlgR family response regulator